MVELVSVIIPVHDGEQTLENCLNAVFQSDYARFEVIVVNDGSSDRTATVANRFPCTLLQLPLCRGAAHARNAGAACSHGGILFFTDCDCIVHSDTISLAVADLQHGDVNTVVGGTYSKQSYDKRFFSDFQSIFIHYAETKNATCPDYIASHVMAIYRTTFLTFGGFNECVYPILEDVEFSHRARDRGLRLQIDPRLQVQHIFNFSVLDSIRNAIRKSQHWTRYTLKRRDFLADSGTASHELKATVALSTLELMLLICVALTGDLIYLTPLGVLFLYQITINRRFIKTIFQTYRWLFTVLALSYYFSVYALAVAVGGMLGLSHEVKSAVTARVTK